MTLGGLTLAAASVRGVGHFDTRDTRQDSYALGHSQNARWLIAAMADGVSEGRNSHLAADIACQQGLSVTRTLLAECAGSLRDLSDNTWQAVADSVRTAILERAQQIYAGKFLDSDGNVADPQDVPASDYGRRMGTTAELLVVDTRPDHQGRHEFLRVVIAGDGSGLVLDPARGWHVLSVGKTQATAIATNAVLALPAATALPVLQHGSLLPGQAVLITTDGIGDFLVDGSTEVGGYLHHEWQRPRSHADMLATTSFVTYQCDDDRTAIVVWA